MEGFIGEVRMFAGNFAPRSWGFCEGQLLAISQNTALFSILGTTYGGDGRTTFGLPDLRGRTPLGQGTGPGLPSVRLGEKGGRYQYTLTSQTLPQHSHTVSVMFNPNPDTKSPQNAFISGLDADDVAGVSNTALGFNNDSSPSHYNSNMFVDGNTGGSQASNNMQPYISIYYIICMFGVYPSRS